jgi:XTP/dITP diphosphohydrolase
MPDRIILVIATRNKGKAAEIVDLLNDFPVDIKNLDDFGAIPEKSKFYRKGTRTAGLSR